MTCLPARTSGAASNLMAAMRLLFALQIDRVDHVCEIKAHPLLLLFEHGKLFGEKRRENVTLAGSLVDRRECSCPAGFPRL